MQQILPDDPYRAARLTLAAKKMQRGSLYLILAGAATALSMAAYLAIGEVAARIPFAGVASALLFMAWRNLASARYQLTLTGVRGAHSVFTEPKE